MPTAYLNWCGAALARATSVSSLKMLAFWLSLILLCASQSGCARKRALLADSQSPATIQTIGKVEYGVETAPDNAYERLPDMGYTNSIPKCENAKPEYPTAMLFAKLPVIKVKVLVIVDTEGDVIEVRPLNEHEVPVEFVTATQNKLRSWCFTPLIREYHGKIERLPYSDTYIFEFEQRRGSGLVN